MRLRTKSVPILLKILNAPEKILTKTPSEVAGEDGIDSDIDFKKREQIVIFPGEKLRKKKIFPHGVVHKLRGQDEVGRWSVKCPRLST